MSKLEEKIENFQYYEKEFATWEAKEIIIDDKKAFWELRKPNSEYQKVCLWRDGYNICVYGDYGSFTFDSMTWLGSPYNLVYDNFGYQMEKLSRESRESLRIFDDDTCKEDIKDWLEDYLDEQNYDNYKELANDIIKFVKDIMYYYYCGLYSIKNIEEYCEENNIAELCDLIKFIIECFENCDEDEWISFLRRSNLDDFEEPYESSLWSAGRTISQNYYINMYALKVLGEKLNGK